jgi:hypothetical protein
MNARTKLTHGIRRGWENHSATVRRATGISNHNTTVVRGDLSSNHSATVVRAAR